MRPVGTAGFLFLLPASKTRRTHSFHSLHNHKIIGGKLSVFCISGYGFVDFDSPAAAQKAVSALKASGVQAQMAKVSCEP